jgi:2-C-methyl-D-erythritol 4-phosphate cytidylyltransferase / 2-C-methyl-D-erythritol 2,4-cyclodiphosphate synthase
MHVAAIVAAGGQGRRLGAERPKQFLDLGDGVPMLRRSIGAIAACALVDEIVVAVPPDEMPDSDGAPAREASKPLRFVVGGMRRQDSVAHALAAVSDVADVIVIHDAARPFVSADLIERTIREAERHGAAIAAVPVVDTVKQVSRGPGSARVVQATVPRHTIYLAQTPQAFRREVLMHAMSGAADLEVTDEAMLVERAGYTVHIVEGDPANMKITTSDDLAQARARVGPAASVPAAAMRIGTGYDLHRLVEGRRLVLAGVVIPWERGLQGHSDADIVCHAVTDAVLGAASAGDIGRLFPDHDPQWKDADSVRLLHHAVDQIRRAGYRVCNVDVTVIAERPKLLPYLDDMRANLARALGVEATAVSVKGKTNEQVGEIGRGEAMACHAVALLARS